MGKWWWENGLMWESVGCKFNSMIIMDRNGTRKPSFLCLESTSASPPSKKHHSSLDTKTPSILSANSIRRTFDYGVLRWIGEVWMCGVFGRGGSIKLLNSYFIIAGFCI